MFSFFSLASNTSLFSQAYYVRNYNLPHAPDSLLAPQFHLKPAPSAPQLISMGDQLNADALNGLNDQLNVEELNTPVTITKGQLAQLELAFHNCQAMAEQVQSLATEIARLRLLSVTPAVTPELRNHAPGPSPKVLHPDPFTGDRLELDTYLTRCQHVFLTQPSLFLKEQQKVLYTASYLKGNVYS